MTATRAQRGPHGHHRHRSRARWRACRSPARRSCSKTPGVADAPGQSLVFGTSRRTSALDATLINGTASHALDYDDVSGVLGGHHSVPVTAPIFALGEQIERIRARQVLAAYVIGVETEVRLARAVNFHHYDKGWHPTATLGTFGAAAAAAHLLKLDVARTAKALALAASFACGHQGQLRHHDEAAAHRPDRRATACSRRCSPSSGFESNPAASRAQAGLAQGLQRRGHVLARADVRGLGQRPGRSRRPRTGSSSFPAAAPRIRPSP